jgi:hypothetical protein
MRKPTSTIMNLMERKLEDGGDAMYFINDGPGSYVESFFSDDEQSDSIATLQKLVQVKQAARLNTQPPAAVAWNQRLELRLKSAIWRSQHPAHPQRSQGASNRRSWEKDLVSTTAVESLIGDLQSKSPASVSRVYQTDFSSGGCVLVRRRFSADYGSAKCSVPTCQYAHGLKPGRRCITIESSLTYGHLQPLRSAALFGGKVLFFKREQPQHSEYYTWLIRKWFCEQCLENFWQAADA